MANTFLTLASFTHLRGDSRHSFDFLAFVLGIVAFRGIECFIFVVSVEVADSGL